MELLDKILHLLGVTRIPHSLSGLLTYQLVSYCIDVVYQQYQYPDGTGFDDSKI